MQPSGKQNAAHRCTLCAPTGGDLFFSDHPISIFAIRMRRKSEVLYFYRDVSGQDQRSYSCTV